VALIQRHRERREPEGKEVSEGKHGFLSEAFIGATPRCGVRPRLRWRLTPVLIAALIALAAPHAIALEVSAPPYARTAPSADGIGKLYMGREIAHVMTYHGADWLERAERTREERPDLVLAALDVRRGMTVADIGTGTGYYARRIAERVGPTGMVYATDIQPEMLKRLELEMSLRAIANVKPVLATPTDPGLAAGSLDLAVMVDVYHELEHPHEVLSAIVRALKPDGRIAFVEFRANDSKVPIKRLHTMSEEQIRKEAAVHGLEWVTTVRDLPWQHVVVFRKNR
jgi:predicted methyltransferase